MTGRPRCDDTALPGRQAGGVLPGGGGEEHAAVLREAGGYELLRRRDDLLDEGVSAVFGVRLGEAELHALHFDAGRFTAEQARQWLLAFGLQPLLFRAAGGG
jgi:hypothetical protein